MHEVLDFLRNNPVGQIIAGTGYSLLQGYLLKNKSKVNNQLIPIINIAATTILGDQLKLNPVMLTTGALSATGIHQFVKTSFVHAFSNPKVEN